jgi:hypothetical protein
MTKQHLIILLLIFILNITGCQNNVSQTTATPFLTSPTATINPIPTILPTLTPPTTPSLFTESQLIHQCTEVLDAFPKDVVSNGVAILNNISETTPGALLMDMTTQRTHQIDLPGEVLRNFVISADKKNVAFESEMINSKTNISQKHLIIASADGQRQMTVPWENEWYGPLGWTDDERLFFLYDDQSLISSGEHNTLFAYSILNPFTGEQEILFPDFPDYIL